MGSITGGGSQGATIPAGKTVRKNGMIVLQGQEETIKTSLVCKIEGASFAYVDMYRQRAKVEIVTCACGEGGDARRNREHVRGDVRV